MLNKIAECNNVNVTTILVLRKRSIDLDFEAMFRELLDVEVSLLFPIVSHEASD